MDKLKLIFILIFLLLAVPCAADVCILNYNVNGIGAPGTESREALQRIVDYLDPDIIIFQEAKGTENPEDFLASNRDYEGFYSGYDEAWNRQMVMSKYDIIDSSIREYPLGEGSLRTLFATTIDLPGPRDLEIFTAHWHASNASIRNNESLESLAIIRAYREKNPSSIYIYAGDLNDEDSSYHITNLLDPNTGLNLLTPVDLNNGSKATINSNLGRETYLSRRIDYVMLSDALVPLYTSGRILNTWTYKSENIPAGLMLTDTINASDHLPVCMCFGMTGSIPGDMDRDNDVDFVDFALFAAHWLESGP